MPADPTCPPPDLAAPAGIPIQAWGTTLQVAGVIYRSAAEDLLCYLPEDPSDARRTMRKLDPTAAEWTAILEQADRLVVEVSDRSSGVTIKAFARKSQRQVDQNASWEVYRRDGYACRYCGRDDVPLTVDHLVRWEEGGPSVPANMVACCRACNRDRGDDGYTDWIQSHRYLRRALGLTAAQREANIRVAGTLATIPRVPRIRSR